MKPAAETLTAHGVERLFAALIMPPKPPFDIDALDLDRPETWPRDAAVAHVLAELIAEAIETDPIMAEAFARKFASALKTSEDREAVLSLFPEDHPARRWIAGH